MNEFWKHFRRFVSTVDVTEEDLCPQVDTSYPAVVKHMEPEVGNVITEENISFPNYRYRVLFPRTCISEPALQDCLEEAVINMYEKFDKLNEQCSEYSFKQYMLFVLEDINISFNRIYFMMTPVIFEKE